MKTPTTLKMTTPSFLSIQVSDWGDYQKQIDRIGKPIVAHSLTHTHYDSHYES